LVLWLSPWLLPRLMGIQYVFTSSNLFLFSKRKEKKKEPYLIWVRATVYASAFVVRWITFLSSLPVHTHGFLNVPLINDCLHGPAHNSNPEMIKAEVFINWSVGQFSCLSRPKMVLVLHFYCIFFGHTDYGTLFNLSLFIYFYFFN